MKIPAGMACLGGHPTASHCEVRLQEHWCAYLIELQGTLATVLPIDMRVPAGELQAWRHRLPGPWG